MFWSFTLPRRLRKLPPRRRRQQRLVVEQLEARLTPSSGEIHGTIWYDANGNGVRDPGEPARPGVTVYLDLKQDGRLDPGDPSTLSAADGSYAFTGLDPGTYVVAEMLPNSWQQTSPGSPPARTVTIPGAPVTINFNSLTSPSDQTIPAYHQAGYTLDTSVNQPTKFEIWGTADTTHYAGKTAASSQWSPATISLTQDSGRPFNLTSMDLASWWNSVYTPTVTFTGTRTDAGSVQQTVTLSNQLQFQTVTFNGFTNLSSVKWSFTGTNDYHQFTNIVVAGTGAPIVTGVDFGVNSYYQPNVGVSDGLALVSAGGSVKFTVALSGGNPYPVTVYYATADGTALAGRDYAATSGAVTITGTQATISVPVIATNAGAPDRFFYLKLTSATNAQVTRGQGIGTIEDDAVVVAANDSYVLSGPSLSVTAPGVLANDMPANRTALTVSLVSGPANGSLTFNANGSFTYTQGPGFSGRDTFTYRALQGTLASNIATVTITTNSANQPPVAGNDSYSVNENQTLIVGAPSTTSLSMNSQAGDYIGQGRTYFFTPATGTFHVQRNYDNGVSFSYQDVNPSEWWYVDFAAPQNATLTPGFYGNAVRYPFQASNQPGLDIAGDGRGSNTLTGNFTVRQAVYDAAGNVLDFDASFEQHSEGATPALFGEIRYFYAPGPAGVLSNDTDQEGELLSAILVNGPSNGTLNLNANGSFTYTPNPNFAGIDTFTYKANDGADSNLATVTIAVNPVNQAPAFTKGPDQLVTENSGAQRVAGWAANIAAGPPNESTQTVNFLVSNDHNALFSVQPAIDAGGTLTYTPAGNAYGVAKVTVQLHDNGGTANGGVDTSPAQTFTITLNDPPAVSDTSYITNENAPLTVTAQGTTSLFLQSQLGDYVGAGNTGTFTPSTGRFTVTSNSDNGVSFYYSDQSPYVWWQGDFAAAFKATLTPGYYGNATRYPFQANNVPGFDIGGDGRGSNTLTGNFTVKQAFFDAAGNPLNFDTNFEQHSEGGTQALFGEFKFNALAGPAGIMSSAVDFVGNPLTALLVTAPTHGQLTLNPNGTFTYTPNPNFFGTDTFQYKANDGYLDSNVATVTITVRNLASSLAISGFPSPAASGSAGTFTVSALDAQGNPVPGYTGTVHFTSSDAQAALPADYTFTAADAGQHTFSATLESAGTQSLTATDTVTSSVTGTQAGIVVNPAGFLVNGFPGTTTAGVAQTFSVTAQNANGTTATGYTGTVHFTSSDAQAALPADYAFTAADAGAHTFSATLKTAGSQSLTATDTATASITSTQTGITVNPAAASNLAVSGFPSPTTAGVPGAFTVMAQDTYGNTATGYTGAVHFTSSDGQLTSGDLPADYTFAAADHGAKTFTAILRTPGTQSITATDTATSSITGTEAGIVVNPPPAPQIVDNGAAGYSEMGTWTTETVPAYGGNERYATSSGTGQNTAIWQVTGLPAGFYQAQVSWHPYPNQAPNAPYAIYDGSTLLQTVTVNQTMPANGPMFGGVPFQSLGTFRISSGTLKVVLSNTGGGTYIVADAMRAAFVPVSSTDLNWSATGDGITGPASVNVQSNFTINRTYNISGAAAPGSFTITYYASPSSSPNQDLSKATLLGSETVSATADLAAGNHSGASPSFQFASGGSYYLLATLSGSFIESDGANDTNDVAVTSQAVQVLGPIIVDNGAAGYSETGVWNTETVLSYGGTERYATSSGTGQNTATWQASGLASGLYQVQATWHPYGNQASNAPYAIYDGATLLQTVPVNQTQMASGSSVGGVPFQTLATVNIASGTLKVVLSNTGNGTYVVADAVRIVPAPVSSTDLNWSASGDGITGPSTVNAQTPFTVSRTYSVGGVAAPGKFTISYYASTSSSTSQDLSQATLLGSETLSAAADLAVGDHSGTSPSLQLPNGGTYYLVAQLTADSSWAESDAANDSNDVSVAPQPVQVSGPVIVDNGTAGYSETGTWATESVLSYGGTERYATSSGSGQNTATWQVAGLPAGLYQVQVTWHAFGNEASNAPYAIYDGATLLQTVRINQTLMPSGSSFGGVAFQTLATVNLTTGTLKVVVSNTGNGSYVVADAMRAAPVPVSSTDLTWSASGDGISGPATVNQQTGFTIARTYTISGAAAPSSFTIAYYASMSSNPKQDLSKATFLGKETVSAAADLAVGNHAGASPTFQFSNGGGYTLFAVLNADNSFTESDAGNDTNNLAVSTQQTDVTGPVIVDNGDPTYSEAGTWASQPDKGAYGGSDRYTLAGGTGSTTATWVVTGLASGTYAVEASWGPYYNQSTNAPYAIYDGATQVQVVTADQTKTPSGASAGGVPFQILTHVTITSGTLTVVVSNSGNNSYVIADALRVE